MKRGTRKLIIRVTSGVLALLMAAAALSALMEQ